MADDGIIRWKLQGWVPSIPWRRLMWMPMMELQESGDQFSAAAGDELKGIEDLLGG